ncbi:MAG: DUF1559 domain-containing protein [Pirellulales bacterium]
MDGDPDRGYGKSQPGGWPYNSLAYMEQSSVHQIGAGIPLITSSSLAAESKVNVTDAKRAALSILAATPVPAFNCPSRRSPIAYPANEACVNAFPQALAHSDYAGNAGVGVQVGFIFPASGDPDTYDWPDHDRGGLTFVRSEVGFRRITDGTSNTMYVGEKYLNPDSYVRSDDPADNNSMFAGHDWDILRWTSSGNPKDGTSWAPLVPIQDRPGIQNIQHFGSAHPAGANYVFCDGSVHGISYSIDSVTWIRIGVRNDELPIDASEL